MNDERSFVGICNIPLDFLFIQRRAWPRRAHVVHNFVLFYSRALNCHEFVVTGVLLSIFLASFTNPPSSPPVGSPTFCAAISCVGYESDGIEAECLQGARLSHPHPRLHSVLSPDFHTACRVISEHPFVASGGGELCPPARPPPALSVSDKWLTRGTALLLPQI